MTEKDGKGKVKTQERRESTKVLLNAMIKLNILCIKILNYTRIFLTPVRMPVIKKTNSLVTKSEQKFSTASRNVE